MDNPLHRIEVWTGQFYRPAELREVGIYLMVPHHSGQSICATLKVQMEILARFQIQHNAEEQIQLSHHGSFPSSGTTLGGSDQQVNAGEDNTAIGEDHTYEGDLRGDALVSEHLDDLYRQQYLQGDDEGNREDWDDEPEDDQYSRRFDALRNPYVRVVHVNGVHYMSLVVCKCQGHDNAHYDLMAECLVPASFTCYQTVFTHAVLDDFRLANLE